MRKSRFSESEIVEILKEAEGGITVADLLRQHGVSRGTFFKWRSKYGGATVADVKRLCEAENTKLKRMYADLALENAAIKDVFRRNRIKPQRNFFPQRHKSREQSAYNRSRAFVSSD
jgi:putative transposase